MTDTTKQKEGEPDVIGVLGAVPLPTLSEAVICIAQHIEMDATEEAAQEGAVLRQAAEAIDSLRAKLEAAERERGDIAAYWGCPKGHDLLSWIVGEHDMDKRTAKYWRQRAEAAEQSLVEQRAEIERETIERATETIRQIGKDWQEAGDYPKFYAAEYLEQQIRSLPIGSPSAEPCERKLGNSTSK